MNKIFNKRTVVLCGFLPTLRKEDISFEQYKAARGLFILDPWERVKVIFSKDDFGNRHPEFIYAVQMAELGAFVGLFYGGIIETFNKTEQYIHRSDTHIYSSVKDAYKELANHSMLAFMKGGIKRAPTFALFNGGFFLISSCCEAYRNKHEIVDSVVAGTVVGSLSRFMFGIKGMISGGLVGGVLGTIYGTLVWLILKLSKTDHMELKYAQFAMSKYKREYLDKPETDEGILEHLYGKSSKSKESPLEDQKKEDKSSKSTEGN